MKTKLAGILFILVLVMAGCSNSSAGDSSDDTTESGSKVLTIGVPTDNRTFDIHDHNNTSTEAIHVNMFSYLVKRGEGSGEFVPDLAETWENVNDTTWSFKLREGVKFHNGEDLTADDVKLTLERVANDEALQEYGNYNQIKEVKVLSDYEFEIITHNPEPALLNRLSRIGSGILPKDYIETEGWEVFLENPAGTGPYQFKEWAKDDRLVIERYEDYFGEKAIWDEVVFRIIPEDSTRVSELLTGGVDLVTNVPPEDVERINTTDNVSAITAEIQRVMMLVIRTAEGWPTADPRVREAIDLAIDKQGIIDSILGGAGTVTKTRVTPGNFGANEDLFGQTNYDPERAKELLAEAGYEDGLEITFSATNGRYLKDKEVAELIQAQLAEVGITVNLELLEYSVFSTKNQEKSFEDMFMIGYGNSMFDAALALEDLTKDEAAGETDYDNPEVEALLKAAEMNMNLEERAEQYQKAQEIIAEDRPHIYLYQLGSIYGVSDRINFEPRLDELFYLDDITLK